MRIRTLVPALACLAAAPFASAADSVPAVKIDGFVDSILSGYSVINSDPETENSNTEFSYAAKLGVAATISDKVAAQIDLFVDGSSQSPAAVNANGDPVTIAGVDSISGVGGNQIAVRQAYGTWKLTDELELKTGKFISNIGWIAVYAPGLYRINSGPIVALYGVDQVGADVKYSKDEFTAALTVANGFFGEGDNGAQSTVGQTDQAMAIGLDLLYAFGNKGSINFEAVYDADANPTGGNGMHLGLNGTATPNEQVTAGAELIYQTVGPVDDAAADATENRLGVMAMVNYKLGAAMSVPASVTGMVQYVGVSNLDNVEDDDGSVMEVSLALLTNPAGTDKLGANLEVYYNKAETDNGATSTDATVLGIAAELLYVF